MTKLFTIFAITLAMATPAFGQFFTNFSSLPANNGAPIVISNGGINATFGTPGTVGFFNNGSLYVGSNRAYVVGAGQSTNITLDVDAIVTANGRNSNGEITGGASSTVPGNTTLGVGDGSISSFDASGTLLETFTFSNAFTDFNFTGPVRSLTLTNNSSEADSFAVLSSLSATAVPEPTSGVVIAGLACLFGLRRRRN